MSKEVFKEWYENYQSEHPGDFDVENGADPIALEDIAEAAFDAGKNYGIKCQLNRTTISDAPIQ